MLKCTANSAPGLIRTKNVNFEGNELTIVHCTGQPKWTLDSNDCQISKVELRILYPHECHYFTSNLQFLYEANSMFCCVFFCFFLVFFPQNFIPVVAISIYSNRDIKFHLVIGIIRLYLPQIPFNTRSSQHHTTIMIKILLKAIMPVVQRMQYVPYYFMNLPWFPHFQTDKFPWVFQYSFPVFFSVYLMNLKIQKSIWQIHFN